MKGIVFTELLEFAESQFGFDIVDEAVEAADLPSGGSYTAVGTYDHMEVHSLVQQLTQRTQVSESELFRLYGVHLLGRFYSLYPGFFAHHQDCFTFLAAVENHIHVEVRKLYPEAELPHFESRLEGEKQMRLIYRSARAFGHLALGLIQGTVAHYQETAEIAVTDRSQGEATEVEFCITRTSVAHHNEMQDTGGENLVVGV